MAELLGDYAHMDTEENDFPADTTTTGIVRTGWKEYGVISRSGDVDWFKVNLVAGEQYRLQIEANPTINGLFAGQLSLYGATGTLIATANTGQGFQSQYLDYTPTATGDYFVAASGPASVTGNYILTVPTGVTGSTSTSTVVGTTANDTLNASATGGDVIDGGSGIDTVVISGARAGFTATKMTSGYTISASSGTWGSSTLMNVERVKFSDVSLALDMGTTQASGQTALLIGAALGRTLAFSNDPIKQAVLGNVIALFDQSQYNMQILAGALMRLNHDSLDIWTLLAGGNDLTHIAQHVLTVVNGQAPDQSTLSAAVAALTAEAGSLTTQGTWLANEALSSANQTQVNLVGLAQTGMVYL
jgi:hypothetical protein